MWNSFNAVANRVKSTAKVIAAEAYETANELRSIHQEDWSSAAQRENQGVGDVGAHDQPYYGDPFQQQEPAHQPSQSFAPIQHPISTAFQSEPGTAPTATTWVPQPAAAAREEVQPPRVPSASTAPPASPSTSGDVAARLAALKLKLQVGGAKPAVTEANPPAASQERPGGALSLVPPSAMAQIPATKQPAPPGPGPASILPPQPAAGNMFAAYAPSRALPSMQQQQQGKEPTSSATARTISWLPKPMPFVPAPQPTTGSPFSNQNSGPFQPRQILPAGTDAQDPVVALPSALAPNAALVPPSLPTTAAAQHPATPLTADAPVAVQAEARAPEEPPRQSFSWDERPAHKPPAETAQTPALGPAASLAGAHPSADEQDAVGSSVADAASWFAGDHALSATDSEPGAPPVSTIPVPLPAGGAAPDSSAHAAGEGSWRELQAAQAEIALLCDAKAEAQAQLQALRLELAQAHSSQEARVAQGLVEAEARAASHQCSIEALTREVEAERAEVAHLRRAAEEASRREAASEEAAAAYRREVDPQLLRQARELELLKLRLAEAEEARARLEEAQGEEAQRRQAQDASQEEEVSAMLASLQRDVQTLQRELASRDRDIASYEVKLESMHDALAQAQGEAEAASRAREQEAARSRDELGDARAEAAELQGQVQAARQEAISVRQEAEQALAVLQRQLDAARAAEAHLASAHSPARAAEAEERLRREVSEAREAAAQASAQASAAQREAHRFGRDLDEARGALDLLESEKNAAVAEASAARDRVALLEADLRAAAAAASSSPLPACAGVLADELEAEVAALRARLRELEAEAAGAALARQQLARLKQQMLTEQDDEEEKVRWRVDAEVKMELERLRRSGEVAEAGSEALDAARAEAAKWQAAAAARDAELANLNHALEELSYESEAAERLRGEAVALTSALASARNEGDAQRLAALRAEEERREAVARAQEAEAAAAAARRETTAAAVRLAEAQRACEAAERRAASLSADAGASIDRRIVVKMLVSFFERGGSGEVLDLMARILGLTDEDKGKIAASQRATGRRTGSTSLAGDVVGRSTPAAPQPASSLATSWIDFLEEEAAAAASEEGDASLGRPVGPGPAASGAPAILPPYTPLTAQGPPPFGRAPYPNLSSGPPPVLGLPDMPDI
ncbi:hypothetical protein ACKKBG_A12250 [Auxenochlorella protothecoides x Auxenochlorella symbiontica]